LDIDKKNTNRYLISALLIGIIFHGTSIFFTLESTYDALIHLFFADHYANSWFEPWNYKWYTGFTVMGYPPLIHQSIALLSYIGGPKFGLFIVAILGVILFITGVYRFSLLLLSNRSIAGYAAIMAVFSSSFLETLHIFGQLPSIVGISILMHTLPEIYLWIKIGKVKHLIIALSLIGVTVTSHHVTPIFGMVFFIFPLIGMVVMDSAREKVLSFKEVTFLSFLKTLWRLSRRIVSFGFGTLVVIIICILPYWVNTKNNPITQVPIPHGSRDNFLEVTSSGMVFFVIPWGILLFLFPYLFYRYYSKRYVFFGLSITLLTILGTGGTTPIPRMILGNNAFDILTLDRFTLWASIMALPIFGEFVYRFVEGDLKHYIRYRLGSIHHKILVGLLALAFLTIGIFTMSLSYFRPTQPQKIEILPILNFLKQDQHDKWRYLPLGFGDQMAWLSANTNAMTVDGNYHSARRLPELTTRAVERLENSKYRGVEGIGSLQQFLTVPEKYNLKYVFSNDKFYDPILYFCGWQRLRQLENGVMVWEKLNVPPLNSILPKEEVAIYQKLMWGILPVITLLLAFMLNVQKIWNRGLKISEVEFADYMRFEDAYGTFRGTVFWSLRIWSYLVLILLGYGVYLYYIKNASQISAENVVTAYYDALDFKEFKKAHSYLDPSSNKKLDQFMLEVAVTDGLLSSYAKLDRIQVEVMVKTDSTAKIKAETNWITPLEKIDKTFYHELSKYQGRWFLKPLDYDLDIPPDQLLAENRTSFYNHGRRRITSEQTYHEDVLKRPVLEVLSAKIIENKGQYSIIGELQNVDNVPADVVVTGTLYNNQEEKLARYNVKDQIKHKLMPKEITSFRINFEGIAWANRKEVKPIIFDPNEYTAVTIKNEPTKFNLHCAGNVTTVDLYKNVALNSITVKDNHLKGVLFNTGLQEVTIPQVLISYYCDKELLWVDHMYLYEGIRPQRKQFFDYELLDIQENTLISDDMTHVLVNGLLNKEISKKIVPNRDSSHTFGQLIPVQGKGYTFIKIEIDNYIGNPK